MKVQRFAAFADGGIGGNAAGVVLCNQLPTPEAMQRVAADVGYSETVFAAPDADTWRVRYFAPQAEVAFCGHATIALGAALVLRQGDGRYVLQLNNSAISVEGQRKGDLIVASLQSPPTHSHAPTARVLAEGLALFALQASDLDPRLPPAIANAGVNHLVLGLKSRERLAAMQYDLEAGRNFMSKEQIGTTSLLFSETPQLFHARNPFAIGGVYEDPATGAAAAALAGYLRDIDWPHGGAITIIQGEDMGQRSVLHADIPAERGSSIRVSGIARILEVQEHPAD